MCYACWAELGHPTSTSPLVHLIASKINQLYEVASAGAALHIVTDDWNLDDEDIQFCLDNLDEYNNYPDLRELQVEIATNLLDMTMSDRGATLALADGFKEEMGDD